MEILAVGIAVLALIVGMLAFYRTRDKAVLKADERLSSIAQRPTESIAAKVRGRDEHNQRMIAATRERIAAIKQEALEELGEDLKSLKQRLERLAERAKRELRDLKSGVDSTVLEMEVGLRLTADDAQAHLKLIEAKRELLLARRAAARNGLSEAAAARRSGLAVYRRSGSLGARPSRQSSRSPAAGAGDACQYRQRSQCNADGHRSATGTKQPSAC